MTLGDQTCATMTELVTDFLEDALPPYEHTSFEAHLVFCADCMTYVDQMRATVAHLAALDASGVDEGERRLLLEAFRGRRA